MARKPRSAPSQSPSPDSGSLPAYLALFYTGLILYVSLHPLSGWRDTGLSPLAFLEADWPRYWTVFDLVVNLGAYVPLGLLLTLAFHRLPTRWLPALLAALLCAGLSFSVEVIQNWLPARVPSNLDLVTNSLGGLIGALLGAVFGPAWFGRLHAWQGQMVAPLPQVELGVTLLALWLLTQLSPETLLFGTGNLRNLLGLPAGLPFEAPLFQRFETALVMVQALGIGLFARSIFAGPALPGWAAFVPAGVWLGAALVVRMAAHAALVGPSEALTWLTPGAQDGLTWGCMVLLPVLWLPEGLRLPLAAFLIMSGAALANLMPDNPYSQAALWAWRQGHFLNFNGLTRVVAGFWPFLAVPYLVWASRRR